MKKILTLLITFLIILSGCSKKAAIKVEDAFNDYKDTSTISVFTDDEIDLSTYLKDTEKYDYSYNFSPSEKEDEIDLVEVPNEPISLEKLEEGEYTLTLRATLKEDKETHVDLFKVYKISTIENELNLTDLKKDTDLDALLKKYGLKYEGDVDTSKAGVYTLKVAKGDKTIGYKSIVVAKDELKDGGIIEAETKKENTTTIKEDKDTAKKDNQAGTSESNKLDKNDSRIALAYSWEGMSGTCENIAYNYLRAIGYLQNNSYEVYLANRYAGNFQKISSPSAFMTLIEYDNGSHVAVYLGNGMALHGNYSGKAKVASMYLSGMNITAYYDMANVGGSSLVEQGGSEKNNTNNNQQLVPNEDGLGKFLYSEQIGNSGTVRDYYENGYKDRYDENLVSEETKKEEQKRDDKIYEMSQQEHDKNRCYLILNEWEEAMNSGDRDRLAEVEATVIWCEQNGYEIKE